MLKSKIVIFFYVNNIVFCYKKTNEKKIQKAIKELSKEYQMSTFGELKWFLRIYMLCNYSQKLLWLSQEAYIKKIANQYKINFTKCLSNTPMTESELLPTNHQLIRPTYQFPDIDLLVHFKSLPKEAASIMLY